MTIAIRGERVTLRQWTDADLDPFAAMKRIGLTPRGEFAHPRLPPEHRSYRHALHAKDRP